MASYQRYAVFAVPTGSFYDRGARWLGWDSVGGAWIRHPDVDLDLRTITARPQRYGFHGTIKPPFQLSDSVAEEKVADAFDTLCADLTPVEIGALDLVRIGRFLAFAPVQPPSDLSALAATTVRALDPFRAPLRQSEIDRRNPAKLSERQRKNLIRWGYPHVMEDFRFHLTLTGPLQPDEVQRTQAALRDWFGDDTPDAMTIRDLCLMGEDASGRFHVLRRQPFGG